MTSLEEIQASPMCFPLAYFPPLLKYTATERERERERETWGRRRGAGRSNKRPSKNQERKEEASRSGLGLRGSSFGGNCEGLFFVLVASVPLVL
jgi:hypothetical protein